MWVQEHIDFEWNGKDHSFAKQGVETLFLQLESFCNMLKSIKKLKKNQTGIWFTTPGFKTSLKKMELDGSETCHSCVKHVALHSTARLKFFEEITLTSKRSYRPKMTLMQPTIISYYFLLSSPIVSTLILQDGSEKKRNKQLYAYCNRFVMKKNQITNIFIGCLTWRYFVTLFCNNLLWGTS